MQRIGHPDSSEYAPFYAGYIARVTDEPLAALEAQARQTAQFLARVPPAKAAHRYAEGKWTVADILGHLADTERVMAYRALRIARGDQTPLPGFEQDDYVRTAHADQRAWAELVRDLATVRAATLALFGSLDDEAWTQHGTANGNRVSVRALAHIVVGHERHHLEILRTRYGLAAD
jgi:uncharacterized damage-inducible protein DinB